jgi:hypothetical protein
LTKNLTGCTGDGLVVALSGVTVDLNGHSIRGNTGDARPCVTRSVTKPALGIYLASSYESSMTRTPIWAIQWRCW